MPRMTDDIMARNLYGAYEGASLGSTATSPSTQGPSVTPVAQEAAAAVEMGAAQRGNPLAFWAMFLVLLLGLMYLAQRVGESSDFSNLKASAYNVLVVALIAVVGIPPIKLAVSKLPVPGALRDYVLAV